MEKVASRGIKIDLHIHSTYSKAKDGQKVEENTLNNVPILVQGLRDNQVEMCAITDHDTFDYDIYSELKKEEAKDNCIQKVLPGIEFSVEFIEGKVIHIVTIFDDRDDEKVRNIQNIMINGKGKTCYKKTKEAYTKSDYFDILSEINIDFIMIAHQKKTPSSQHKPHANDVMSLGKEVFNELVFMDYFDAYEFRNKKNEIYNKIYSFENSMEEKLRFLTGSDCHRWKYYPYTEENEKTEFKYTYIKSLPSFKGLAMAVTDHHRIELENSFYNPNEKYVKEVIMEIDGEKNIIPLSKGINVVIGDNSVGKSLFLNAITGNCKKIDRRLYAGYEKYMEKNKLKFGTIISEEDIFRFNQQGEIRSIFDEDGLKPDKYLSNFYPNEINSAKYRSVVDAEIQRMYKAIEKKFSYDDAIKKLPKFQIPTEDTDDKSITFIDNVKKNETKELQMLVDSFEKTIDDMNQLLKSKALMDNDRKHIQTTIEMFRLMNEKYRKVLNEQKLENEKINILILILKTIKQNIVGKSQMNRLFFRIMWNRKKLPLKVWLKY